MMTRVLGTYLSALGVLDAVDQKLDLALGIGADGRHDGQRSLS